LAINLIFDFSPGAAIDQTGPHVCGKIMIPAVSPKAFVTHYPFALVQDGITGEMGAGN